MNNKKIIVSLRELNADDKIKQEVYYREKRLHDEASALGSARREGIAEGIAEERQRTIAKLRSMGMTEDEISKFYSN